MEENKTTEQIFDLINHKSFLQLSDLERSVVLSQMTEDEYHTMYELSHSLPEVVKINNELDVNENVKNRILAKVHKKSNPENGVFIWIRKPIPLYQAIAAAVLAVFFMASIFYLTKPNAGNHHEVVYETKRDTIYVQIAKSLQSTKRIDTLAMNEDEKINTYSKAIQHNVKSNIIQVSNCQSLKKHQSLKQFMVSL
jgi:hypothetical protein